MVYAEKQKVEREDEKSWFLLNNRIWSTPLSNSLPPSIHLFIPFFFNFVKLKRCVDDGENFRVSRNFYYITTRNIHIKEVKRRGDGLELRVVASRFYHGKRQHCEDYESFLFSTWKCNINSVDYLVSNQHHLLLDVQEGERGKIVIIVTCLVSLSFTSL